MTDDNGAHRLLAPPRPAPTAALPDPGAVHRFLHAHPDFLARHPELYATLAPPERVHGDGLADHMAALLRAARRQNERLRADVRHRRVDASVADRVERALLGLLRAADPLEWIAVELAPTLGLDSAAVRLEATSASASASASADRPSAAERAPVLARGDTDRLLGADPIRFRDAPRDCAVLHGEASPLVRRDVLLRVEPAGGVGVLALGSRFDAASGAGTALPGPGAERPLLLLRRAVEAALERA